MSAFRFKQFSVNQDRAALKVGTDAVLLGATMTLPEMASDILDIGTGTGVIALMAAQRLKSRNREVSRPEQLRQKREWPIPSALPPNWKITAIDIDGPSIEDARENFAASPWSDSLEARCISLQDYSSGCGEYDLIFSNPPFYDNSIKNPSARESTARHTTNLSWRDILAFAADHLRRPMTDGPATVRANGMSEGGTMSMILPAEEEKRLLRTAASFGLYPFRIIRISTVTSKPPRRIIVEFSFVKTPVPAENSLILNNGSIRSSEYSKLTEDFYL